MHNNIEIKYIQIINIYYLVITFLSFRLAADTYSTIAIFTSKLTPLNVGLSKPNITCVCSDYLKTIKYMIFFRTTSIFHSNYLRDLNNYISNIEIIINYVMSFTLNVRQDNALASPIASPIPSCLNSSTMSRLGIVSPLSSSTNIQPAANTSSSISNLNPMLRLQSISVGLSTPTTTISTNPTVPTSSSIPSTSTSQDTATTTFGFGITSSIRNMFINPRVTTSTNTTPTSPSLTRSRADSNSSTSSTDSGDRADSDVDVDYDPDNYERRIIVRYQHSDDEHA